MNRDIFLVILFSFAVLTSATHAETHLSVCPGKMIGSPLTGSLEVVGPFETGVHYGVDYKTNGEKVVSVADGTVSAIKWDLRELPTSNTRTGLAIQGWGRYVIVHHADGGESLYAHLDKNSTDSLKEGMPITKGRQQLETGESSTSLRPLRAKFTGSGSSP
ncbi:MAG: hypothetical protein A2070_02945 [Bdellovibrionales bacterium GWC1_52_8]|nr:MAG: hypothetical protein A2Z97_08545 [Bdellovibrionales bacterium GWB1_52_6]OFZ02405.1 MAG: hypothetical protein A2X97_12710 [Bdellovibrionales bacterium GWA1_52_35]OFZ34336.1 MAG: hypothetical protein A2070_02945 [Bdellovibrionales bacterium GWC1_52_8]HCM41566.1 hypothetical protein [Bdellovibrionales bacterium]